jgi:hypothetical protein
MAWIQLTEVFLEPLAELEPKLRAKVISLLGELDHIPHGGDFKLEGAVPIDLDRFEIALNEEWVLEYRLVSDGGLVKQLRRIDVILRPPRKPLSLRI